MPKYQSVHPVYSIDAGPYSLWYGPSGSKDAPLTPVQELGICDQCSAVVYDLKVHNRWHSKQRRDKA